MVNDHIFQGIPLPDVPVEANRLRSKGRKDIYAFTESIKTFMNYTNSIIEQINEYFFLKNIIRKK